MWEKDLSDLSNSAGRQHGMITSAQATRLGVTDAALAHLEESRLVKPLDWNVYQLVGSPLGPIHAYPYAAWLAMAPDLFASERPKPAADVVLSHESACNVHGMGSLAIPFVTFTAPEERESPRATRLTVAPLTAPEITVSGGVPVTTPHRTILDLVRSYVGHDDVAEALTDAVQQDLVDLRALYDDLATLADEYGLPAKAPAFADYFLAELDAASLSPRNLRAYAALRHPDQVAQVRRGVTRVLAEARGGTGSEDVLVPQDDELSWDLAADIVARTGMCA
jgi:predicted transcriptional regulator of viral defense system